MRTPSLWSCKAFTPSLSGGYQQKIPREIFLLCRTSNRPDGPPRENALNPANFAISDALPLQTTNYPFFTEQPIQALSRQARA